MYSNTYWITQMVITIVLGLGVPTILGLGILGWRRLSLRKRELDLRQQELFLESESLKIKRLELEQSPSTTSRDR
ncbi:hypothetical protein [Spirochaeta lutea]|uniref:Lipopolysaccharide assembly protein A domain-containing protein n=1 Tax=Spirochaeta lutea TaxID=1480694 RepID=A0A098QYE6_9SPIO|nr:hypothetical protein [Spirochaeta lutea]KGE72453.1 hypothetical protein DC28_07305 [Spirochaeta lutea]